MREFEFWRDITGKIHLADAAEPVTLCGDYNTHMTETTTHTPLCRECIAERDGREP